MIYTIIFLRTEKENMYVQRLHRPMRSERESKDNNVGHRSPSFIYHGIRLYILVETKQNVSPAGHNWFKGEKIKKKVLFRVIE